jgi:DNA-binding transcriptional LysR family regulator
VAVRLARQPASTNVIARRIASIRTVICASPDYLARRGCPQIPEDLALHDTLSFTYLSTGDDWTLRDTSDHQTTVRVRPQIHASNGDILCEMAVQGCGVINQPDFIVERHIALGHSWCRSCKAGQPRASTFTPFTSAASFCRPRCGCSSTISTRWRGTGNPAAKRCQTGPQWHQVAS